MAAYRFNRMEIAGSLGDLGTVLPIAIGMILINRLSPTGLFFAVGLFYILSGIYFGVTVSVQPMKVVGAYAIATAMTPEQVSASGLLLGAVLLLLGLTGAVTLLGKYIPGAVIRGVQLSTGTLLMTQGIRFMAGTSGFQAMRQMAEPYLALQQIGPVPVGLLLGVTGSVVTLLLLDNRRFPAGLVVVAGGMVLGVLFGTHEGFNGMKIGLNPPPWLPFGIPSFVDLNFALFALVLPQIPMTLGNAVIANADLSREYFGESARKVTCRGLAVSMGLANLGSFLVGGMPMCHGAGGLAAHYRFGARTAGSNLFIGAVFLLMALFLGPRAIAVFHLLPMAVLGVLLLFAGSQLALMILDLKTRKDLFVALIMMGITLASNLAFGFVAGIAVAYLLRSERFTV